MSNFYTISEYLLLHFIVIFTQNGVLEGKTSPHDRYAPCAVEDLQEKGYAYWALGHVHKRQRVTADPEAWYSGNIQGRNSAETGVRGGLLVVIDEGGYVETEFRSFAPIQWVEIVLDDVQELHTVENIRRRIVADFSVRTGEDVAEAWMLRVRLEGRTPLAQDLQPSPLSPLCASRGEFCLWCARSISFLVTCLLSDSLIFHIFLPYPL